MCGRFAAAYDRERLAERFGAQIDAGLPGPSWNVAPTQTVALAAQDGRGIRHLAPAYWTFVPSWSHSLKLDYPTHNARIESALDKRTFADAARRQRALIPATGYYEWDGGHRPHYFHGDDVLLLAGLYNWWRADDRSPWLLTCTILTREAVGAAAQVHDRMPVLVGDDLIDDWLSPQADAVRLLPEASDRGAELSQHLASHTVRRLKGDGPQLIEPDEFTLNI